MTMRYEHDHEKDVIYFGQTNFRNQMRKFGIKTDDRRRHIYIIGKTGVGKTTMLENMILADIYAGHGCCYIDPHGDTAEKLLDYIPSWRINDVVYFNPADLEYPVGFNILEAVDGSQRHLIAAGMMSVFKKIWENVWSARMEYILNNTILALLENPGTTLLGINRMLSDADYRKQIVMNVKDPIVKQFWIKEFESYQSKFASEAVAPIQNKVGQFLSASIIRNIVAQSKSTINPRRIMDDQMIFIVNLAKGRIGEDAMKLLGGMVITKIQTGAMERVDMPEADRQDFYMYVDEFQNFANESFASILSEARKYRLSLVMAHQFIAQLTEEVRDAVFGNIGTLISFRVGSPDARFMEDEFMPRFIPEDLVNLAKFQVYVKLMIDGITSQPFSALTLPPIAVRTGSEQKVIEQSRERYAGNREEIEKHVSAWSGFGDDVDVEAELKASKDAKKEAKKAQYNHEYTCTRCKKVFGLPVELDRARPIYCEECIPIIKEEREKSKGKGRGRMDAAAKRRDDTPKKVLATPPKIREGEAVVKEVGQSVGLSALRSDARGTGEEKKAEDVREVKDVPGSENKAGSGSVSTAGKDVNNAEDVTEVGEVNKAEDVKEVKQVEPEVKAGDVLRFDSAPSSEDISAKKEASQMNAKPSEERRDQKNNSNNSGSEEGRKRKRRSRNRNRGDRGGGGSGQQGGASSPKPLLTSPLKGGGSGQSDQDKKPQSRPDFKVEPQSRLEPKVESTPVQKPAEDRSQDKPAPPAPQQVRADQIVKFDE